MLITKELDPNSIPVQAKIHWIAFLGPVLSALMFGLALFGQIIASMSGSVVGLKLLFITTLVSLLPLAIRYFQVKGRSYIISKPYLIVEESFLWGIRKEIEIFKINNLEIHQTFLDKLVNAGNIIVYSSNDQAIKLKNISNPMSFKNKIQLVK